MSDGDAYITGIGQSVVGRKLTRRPLLLTVDAVKEALDNAGLTIDQIDGVSTYPGRMGGYLGFSPVGAEELVEALRIKATWFAGGLELTSQLGAVVAAVGAVKAGQARHVICFRTVYEAAALDRPDEWPADRPERVDGWPSWFTPFHSYSAANSFAQYATRHFKKYGMTREQLAQISLTDRKHGALNPRALVRDPLTMDEYLSAPMISSPLCLFDCDRYTDASTVLIVSAGSAIDEVTCTPIRIAAMAACYDIPSWDQTDWYAAYQAGPQLWKNTDYTPADVDTAQLYDGFSFITCQWLEALGFCEIGGAGEFLDGGHNIALDGVLPLNTGGGQIGAGRLHGFGFPHEAVVQLRGQGGERQIQGDPRVAVCSSGGGPYATAMLLAND
ncbi:diterpenoid dioxygenase [Mycolicibacter heraklionensis]|uniref:Diterpenoid dioxygenase n=1 Tax=Mycolicibacter heraklionensis TaxID=512402 RepID=A0ABR5FFG9_9MYCO|nr:diterpenoid dioxygenase [Mycolicibacter heraklionensis]